MSQSIHNDGNWQRVDTGEWVSKAEHDNLRFALTDALVREDALRGEVERLTAALREVVEICDEGDTGADFKRVVSAMQHASEALAARASQPQTYESALRAGMRQNYAQQADRAVDKMLDEKERI